jgi:2-oxo-3-hexenedioate decarboxylase
MYPTARCVHALAQKQGEDMTEAATSGATTSSATIRKIADEAIPAFNSGGRHVTSFSARYPDLNLDGAYRVAALINNMRAEQHYKPLGRKIGFTNRRMWDEYGVRAPNWGYVYDRTMHDLAVPLPLAPYTEPKIEPEIMFGLAAAPSPGMDDAALLSCIAWVVHGFEIVQSIFPDWKFSAADSIVADAMHGALLVGPHHDIGSRAGEWLRTLKNFDIELYCNGQLMELLARDPDNLPLASGEIVSTGTLTRALPVKVGETWTTKLKDIAIEGISLRFC